MRVLVLGNGGREHSLVWKLAQSPEVEKICSIPSSDAMFEINNYVGIDGFGVLDFEPIVETVQDLGIDLTVVGPEAPLVEGIGDVWEAKGLKEKGHYLFGPSKEAAKLEGSKIFARHFMNSQGIPQPRFVEFFNASEAKSRAHYCHNEWDGVVVKADGLAAGKGVRVCDTLEDTLKAIQEIMVDKVHGDAGDRILLEQKLIGEEASYIVLCDGKNFVQLLPSQDHKQAYDNDKGPMTGGMGAFAPARLITPEIEVRIIKEIVEPTVTGMAEKGIPYIGAMYFGLMITEQGPKVLEINCRFGDPETQPLMALLKSDLATVLYKAAQGSLEDARLEWDSRTAVTVVLATKGYPKDYKANTGNKITLPDLARDNVHIFHSGTEIEMDQDYYINSGGRVLSVTAVADNLSSARNLAYSLIGPHKGGVYFEGMHYRKDIGAKGIKHEPPN
ncbi:phosphoribosylamine--glycine ligase [Candidatus Woesearchaeota archaeon]|nr:MAG: phosphoribosylamine--glycine ligase [Candidatus Woesearchaeota archaeon]